MRNRLRLWRESLGLTQKQLAEGVGVGQSAIRDWGSGRYRPMKHSLGKVRRFSSGQCLSSISSNRDHRIIPRVTNIILSWHRVTALRDPNGRSPAVVRMVNPLRYGLALSNSTVMPSHCARNTYNTSDMQNEKA